MPDMLIDYVPGQLILGDESDVIEQAIDRETLRQHLQDDLVFGGLLTTTPLLKQSTNESEASATFVIVTNQVNRHGNKHRLHQSKAGKGLQPDDWYLQPTVLFEHGLNPHWSLPVGSARDRSGKTHLKVSQSQAVSTCFFAQNLPVPMDIFRLVNAGAMGMASITVDAELALRLPPSANGRSGMEIVQSRMIEWSVCAIGVDQGAVRQAFSDRKVGGEKLHENTLRILEPNVEAKPAVGIGYDFGRLEQRLDLIATGLEKLITPPAAPLTPAVTPEVPSDSTAQPAEIQQTLTAPAPAVEVPPVVTATIDTATLTQALQKSFAPLADGVKQLHQRVEQSVPKR